MLNLLTDNEAVQILTVMGTLIGALVTGLVTFIIAKMKEQTELQKFYEDKIARLLENQSNEIHALKEENERLSREVRTLTQQIIDLKNNQVHISQP